VSGPSGRARAGRARAAAALAALAAAALACGGPPRKVTTTMKRRYIESNDHSDERNALEPPVVRIH